MNENTDQNIEQQPTTPTPEASGDQGEKLFTQADLDRIIGERLARERAKAEPSSEDAREADLKAREARLSCREYIAGEGYPADLLELFDTTDAEKFKAAVEKLDGMVGSTMGASAPAFRNYIGTIFIFILVCNISGLFGLRPPTADYGTTLALGLMTFTLITFNKFKHKGAKGVLKGLCDPWPIWAPINVIGDVAVPISLSLRLFANVLSGTVMLALVYGLLSKIAIVWPAALHVYFDLFSGAIQTYVFCMLTMTYITDACTTGE